MEPIWKKIRQVAGGKMLWLSSTRSKCLPGGGVVDVPEVSKHLITHLNGGSNETRVGTPPSFNDNTFKIKCQVLRFMVKLHQKKFYLKSKLII